MRARRLLVGTLLAVAAVSCASDSTAADGPIAIDGTVHIVDSGVRLPDAMIDAPSLIVTGTFSADIDSSAWSSMTSAAIYSQGALALSGDDGAGRVISIGADVPGPGTYAVGPQETTTFSLNDHDTLYLAMASSGSGSLTVQSISATRVTGTFTFVAAEVGGNGMRNVLNGMFDLAF